MHSEPPSPTEAATTGAAVPASTLIHLHRALRKEVGALAAIHALHDAGYATGDHFFRELEQWWGEAPEGLQQDRFWKVLGEYFASKGWGDLSHESIHPGVGMLRARAWGESDPAASEAQPNCAFSSGLLTHILGRVAGGAVAVLETACRSRGDDECRFLFGSEPAIHEIYGLLLADESLEAALERL